jgi:hypothetical protein
MKKTLTLTAAFATYGAELLNPRWAFSAIARDGSLVLSCWNHFLKKFLDGHERYEDRLSRWTANTPGKQLLIEHLQLAVAKKLPVRMVVATLWEPRERTNNDASALRKTFAVHRNTVGKVVEYDGDRFAIDFHPSQLPRIAPIQQIVWSRVT